MSNPPDDIVSEASSPAQARRMRRPRTSLACQRCKSRKQKCDGEQPVCSKCRIHGSECRYVPSTALKPSEQRSYIKTLKERITQLEASLAAAESLAADNNPSRASTSSYVLPPPDSPLSRIVRDLTLNASGYSYLGGTSNITVARILETALEPATGASQSRQSSTAQKSLEGIGEPSNDPLVTRKYSRLEVQQADITPLSDPSVEPLFQAYLALVCPFYPIVHSKKLRDMHNRRQKPNDLYEVCTLRLVYAIGGVTLELSGAKRGHRSESDQHYEAAMAHRSTMMRCIDRREIRYLALASLYCLRAPRSPGPWTMIGLAVKLCVSMGLHRRACTSTFGIKSELDKRLFWTCYMLDREVTLTMGRPPSICDHDIDTQFPIDVDEDNMEPDDFRKAMIRDPDAPVEKATTLTFFLHFLKLKRIVSDIQHTVYRVDKSVENPAALVDGFIEQFRVWRQRLPPSHPDTMPRNLVTQCEMHYYTCIRFLLFPQLSHDNSEPRHLGMLVDASVGVCRSFKLMHQQFISTCYTPMSTFNVFLAGVTLLCYQRLSRYKPSSIVIDTRPSQIEEALNDCTIMLYIFTERWQPADKYRRAFECLRQLIASGRNQDQGQQNFELFASPDTVAQGEALEHLQNICDDLGIDVLSHMGVGIDGDNRVHSTSHPGHASLLPLPPYNTGTVDDVYAFDDTEMYAFDPFPPDLSFMSNVDQGNGGIAFSG